MGRRKENKSRVGSSSGTGRGRSNIDDTRSGASSTSSKRKRSEIKHDELKDTRKLDSNDEAFHLSLDDMRVIIDIILTRKIPTPETYKQWDEYARSFYLKMCTCYGVDYTHLEEEEDDDDDENGKKQLLSANNAPCQLPLDDTISHTPVVSTGMEKTQPSTWKERLNSLRAFQKKSPVGSPEADRLKREMELLEFEEFTSVKPARHGPLKTGWYSPGKEPDRIPYHLYLLIKKAVDIKERNGIDLAIVEEKIGFFCNYFHSHLPTGWEYKPDNSISIIADYDPMREPKYLMTGFTPIKHLDKFEIDVDKSYLTEEEMVGVMSIIHSRKTPTFRKMSWRKVLFYYQLCSCFGIDYQHLEAASDDDVCLMNMGRNS